MPKSCTHNVSTMGTKDERIYVRFKSGDKENLKVTARLKGMTVSTLLHSLGIKAAFEAQREFGGAFEEMRAQLRSEELELSKGKTLEQQDRSTAETYHDEEWIEFPSDIAEEPETNNHRKVS